MSSSKLVRVLSTLSKDEWQSLRKYLRVYNREESDHFRLFDRISKKQKEIDASFDLAKIKSKNFPKLNDKAFGSLQSRLYKEICEWLAIEEFKSEKYAQELLLLKTFNDRGLYKDADSVAKKLEANINGTNELDLEKSSALQKILHYQYYSDNPIKYDLKRNLLKDLVNTHIDKFNESSLLYCAELINWGRIKNINYEYELKGLRELVRFSESKEIIQDLSKVTSLVENGEASLLIGLSENLFSGKYKKNTELHDLISFYLIRYSLKAWMERKLKDTEIIIKLYEYGLSSGVLLKSGKIPQTRFYNMIATLGALKSFEWTQTFIYNWIDKVETQNVDSVLSLSLAYNCFYHNEYKKMRTHLNNVNSEYLVHKIIVLGLKMISYYKDVSSNRLLVNHIENFKRTLKRNKTEISSELYQSHWNLIKVIESLSQKIYGDEKLKLSDYNHLIYRKWCELEIK